MEEGERQELPLEDYKYQYNHPKFHPIQEYLAVESDVPTFVLEVTFPRIVLFYHPNSHACREFQSHFIALAREVRRRSIRVPVEFWAVSCQVHRSVCDDLVIRTVPQLKAYVSGRIEGVELERTKNNDLNVDRVFSILEVSMKDVREELKGAGVSDVKHDLPQDAILAENANMILHPLSNLENVYSDAMISCLKSIDDIGNLAWTPRKEQVLNEWLDLLHWSLPSRDFAPLVNILQDLKSREIKDFHSILAGHDYYHTPQLHTWSDNCKWTCGLWNLFHIVSVGVVEQHGQVMGDTRRTQLLYVMTVVRDYVDEFGFGDDPEAQNGLLQAYEECLASETCQEETLGHNFGLLGSWLRRRSGATTERRNFALWLWRFHNTQRRKRGTIHHAVEWPPPKLCPLCHASQPNDEITSGEEDVWNTQAVYEHLRNTYWPKVLQSPRLVVLDRRGHAGRWFSLFYGRHVFHTSSWIWISLTLLLILLMIQWYSYPRYQWRRRRPWRPGHLKRDVYGIDDYLVETSSTGVAPLGPQKTRRRHPASSSRSSARITPRPFLDG